MGLRPELRALWPAACQNGSLPGPQGVILLALADSPNSSYRGGLLKLL